MESTVKLLDVVALARDIPEHHLVRGQVGTIVEILGTDSFEVEFSDDAGRTYALAALKSADLIVLSYKPAHAA
jgi:Domain of unknown function (DUF4926)